MAEPIPLNLPPRDPREALYRRLENAPQEHAEALLASYDILQGLHDRGVLELFKGGLGSSDKVLQILVDTGNSPEVIRAIRNLMVLAKILDAVDPELLETLESAIPVTLAEAKTSKAPGPWELIKRARSEDTRRALGVLTNVLMAFGRALRSGKSDERK
jgi:uncharacterized protein YjgD (DUF1641 family)